MVHLALLLSGKRSFDKFLNKNLIDPIQIKRVYALNILDFGIDARWLYQISGVKGLIPQDTIVCCLHYAVE